MITDFKSAKVTIRTQNRLQHVVAINGCCYGRDNRPDKGDYLKLCGQSFWSFISGEEDFYVQIIEPLGHRAKEKNEAFQQASDKLINRMTRDFMAQFCLEDGSIDWSLLVRFNSSAKKQSGSS